LANGIYYLETQPYVNEDFSNKMLWRVIFNHIWNWTNSMFFCACHCVGLKFIVWILQNNVLFFSFPMLLEW
jgi:hypothetical protein